MSDAPAAQTVKGSALSRLKQASGCGIAVATTALPH